MEYYIISKMLEQGLDVYLPVVDDHGVDAVVRKGDGPFVEVQIKARSKDVKSPYYEAFFAAINHKTRKNHFYIFYSEGMNKMWIISSKEFEEYAANNNKKKNIKLNGQRGDESYPYEKFEGYCTENFDVLFK